MFFWLSNVSDPAEWACFVSDQSRPFCFSHWISRFHSTKFNANSFLDFFGLSKSGLALIEQQTGVFLTWWSTDDDAWLNLQIYFRTEKKWQPASTPNHREEIAAFEIERGFIEELLFDSHRKSHRRTVAEKETSKRTGEIL